MGKKDFCCAYGCSHERSKGATCAFYSIPSDHKLRKSWLDKISRVTKVLVNGQTVTKPWEPSKSSKLCGCHFENPPPSQSRKKWNIVPSIFKHRSAKITTPRPIRERNPLTSRSTAPRSEKIVLPQSLQIMPKLNRRKSRLGRQYKRDYLKKKVNTEKPPKGPVKVNSPDTSSTNASQFSTQSDLLELTDRSVPTKNLTEPSEHSYAAAQHQASERENIQPSEHSYAAAQHQASERENIQPSEHSYAAAQHQASECENIQPGVHVYAPAQHKVCESENVTHSEISSSHPTDNTEIQAEEIVTSSTHKLLVQELKRFKWSTYYSFLEYENSFCLVRFYTGCGSGPSVKLSILIDSDFKCCVKVHRKPLNNTHAIWENLPARFDTARAVSKLIERIENMNVCTGNTEQKYIELVQIGDTMTRGTDIQVAAYREGDFGAQYNSTIRTVNCSMLTYRNTKCRQCAEYGYVLQKRVHRLSLKLNTDRVFTHSSYKHKDMSRSDLCQKITEQKQEIKSLQGEVCRLKRECEKEKQKKDVNRYKNLEMSELISFCLKNFNEAFPNGNNKQRIFFEQQLLHSRKKDKHGMRWHPMIMRWCHNIRSKSITAYKTLRESGFIKLPANRTLLKNKRFLESDAANYNDVIDTEKVMIEADDDVIDNNVIDNEVIDADDGVIDNSVIDNEVIEADDDVIDNNVIDNEVIEADDRVMDNEVMDVNEDVIDNVVDADDDMNDDADG